MRALLFSQFLVGLQFLQAASSSFFSLHVFRDFRHAAYVSCQCYSFYALCVFAVKAGNVWWFQIAQRFGTRSEVVRFLLLLCTNMFHAEWIGLCVHSCDVLWWSSTLTPAFHLSHPPHAYLPCQIERTLRWRAHVFKKEKGVEAVRPQEV